MIDGSELKPVIRLNRFPVEARDGRRRRREPSGERETEGGRERGWWMEASKDRVPSTYCPSCVSGVCGGGDGEGRGESCTLYVSGLGCACWEMWPCVQTRRRILIWTADAVECNRKAPQLPADEVKVNGRGPRERYGDLAGWR